MGCLGLRYMGIRFDGWLHGYRSPRWQLMDATMLDCRDDWEEK